MKLKVERLYPKEDYTIGKMYIDGKYFCDTLEDAERDIERDGKIPQKTAIPKGEYTVIFNMSPRFGRNLPRLLDVPHFDGILRPSECSYRESTAARRENNHRNCVTRHTKALFDLLKDTRLIMIQLLSEIIY